MQLRRFFNAPIAARTFRFGFVLVASLALLLGAAGVTGRAQANHDPVCSEPGVIPGTPSWGACRR